MKTYFNTNFRSRTNLYKHYEKPKLTDANVTVLAKDTMLVPFQLSLLLVIYISSLVNQLLANAAFRLDEYWEVQIARVT